MSAGLKMSNDVVYFCTDINNKPFGPLFDDVNDAHAWQQANVSPHVLTKIISRQIVNNVIPDYDFDTQGRK